MGPRVPKVYEGFFFIHLESLEKKNRNFGIIRYVNYST